MVTITEETLSPTFTDSKEAMLDYDRVTGHLQSMLFSIKEMHF